MSETLRGIIIDCVAGVSALFVLGAAFFIYDLGLQHVYEELHDSVPSYLPLKREIGN